jgi:hypothetical protein
VDWPEPNTLTYWGPILAAIVAIGTIFGWFKAPLRWWQSRPRSKVEGTIIFVSNDRQCNWGEAKLKDEPATHINGHWYVTNNTGRDVRILKASLRRSFLMWVRKHKAIVTNVFTRDPYDERYAFGEHSIPPNQTLEVSAEFTYFPPIGRAPRPIIADVIFIDNQATEHRVRTTFTYRGPQPVHPLIVSPRLFGRVG